MNSRVADMARFYDLLDHLAVRVGALRVLADCTGRMKWPQRGVYFRHRHAHRVEEPYATPRPCPAGSCSMR